MSHTRCNYCGQVVQFVEIRGNSTCPVCRQSSTSCCEGGSCNISVETHDYASPSTSVKTHDNASPHDVKAYDHASHDNASLLDHVSLPHHR